MSAPVLSPAEQAEAQRFGIQDAEEFAEIIERFDDVVPCAASGCDTAATAVVLTRCCGFQWFACDPHLARGIRESREFLLLMMLRGNLPQCRRCGHKFGFGDAFEDIYRVVPL